MNRKHSDRMLFHIHIRTKYQNRINKLSLFSLKSLLLSHGFVYVKDLLLYKEIKTVRDNLIIVNLIKKRIVYLETTELILGVNDA